MPLEFNKSADQKHKEKLDSKVISAHWVQNRVVAGGKAMVEVRTAFVGNAAPIKITAKTEGGESGGTLSDKIRANLYRGEIELKESLPQGALLYFEVECPDSGGASGRSNSVPVLLPPKISELKWSQDLARRGDVLTLSAKVKDVPVETACAIHVFEYDGNGAHDPITTLTGKVLDQKVEVLWEYEYHDDTDEIAAQDDLDPYGTKYNAPEYFFVVDIFGFQVGKKQESGILKFQDFIEVRLPPELIASGEEAPEVTVTLPDGTQKTMVFDDDGYGTLEDVPPGPCDITVEPKEKTS